MKRVFKTGANRDVSHNKINFLSYLTTLRICRYGKYMKENEKKYGRANYRKGMPILEVWESGQRHFTTLMIKDLYGTKSSEWKEWEEMNKELGHDIPKDYDEASAIEFFLEAREYSKDKK